MKLYEIPKNSKILLPIGGPERETKEEVCTFHHIDGIYSYITTPQGDVVHLGALAEVVLEGGVYKPV